MSDYRGGHIIRIKLTNFMTYDEMEIYPKHGLNLIIGLNGCGKSAIMSGICLGLGGKPQLTGRSTQLSDFIKHGCNQAFIEIELENPSETNAVITRNIDKQTTTWQLNQNLVPFNVIEETVQSFNIDVSNLCQFLPQEKVQEFAVMDKTARLENMLQSIGEPHLFETFKDLKKLNQESLDINKDLNLYFKRKKEEDEKIKRLRVEVDKQEEILRSKEHLKSFEQFKMFTLYRKMRHQIYEYKEDQKSIRKLKENLIEETNLIEGEIQIKEGQLQDCLKLVQEKDERVTQTVEEISKKKSEISTFLETVDTVKMEYENKVIGRKIQLRKLAMINKQKENLERLHSESLEKIPILKQQDEELTTQLGQINAAISKLESEISVINNKVDQLDQSIKKNRAEVEQMQNEEHKKMEFLKEKFEGTYKGNLWLQENKDKFKAQVYPPILLLLNLESDDHRKYIESCVEVNGLISFICIAREDFDLLSQQLKGTLNLQVNIVLVPELSLEDFESPIVSEELSEMGVDCFMKDIISAPSSIMCFLCDCYKLHMIPLCNSNAKSHFEKLLEHFDSFCTPDEKFMKRRSKYGEQNFSIRQEYIQCENFISSSKNYSSQLEELMERNQSEEYLVTIFRKKLTELKKDLRRKEKEKNNIDEEIEAVRASLQHYSSYEWQMRQKKKAYKKMNEELINEKISSSTVGNKMEELNNYLLIKDQMFDQLMECVKNFIALKQDKMTCNLKLTLIKTKITILQNKIEENKKKQEEFEEKIRDSRNSSNEIVSKGYEVMAELIKLVPDEIQSKESCAVDENSDSYRKRLAKKFDEVAPALNRMFLHCKDFSELDVEREIQQLKAQLEINYDSEEIEAACKEFSKRKQVVTEIEKKIENMQCRLKDVSKDMDRKKGKWLPDVEKLIKTINDKFSHFYERIDCAGEISLDTCNHSEDFLNYGLKISLKYRDSEPFAELSKAHSGGERSVAAIIFILSLQDLIKVPFRCIDEINQGMDEANERSIYDLIAENLNNGSRSQYFLLTPKLLMDLEMIEEKDVEVHIIFNSSFLQTNLNVKNHIELMKQEMEC